MILSSILSFLDLFTTYFITQNGGVELNALARFLTLPVFLFAKLIVSVGLTVFVILGKVWHVKTPLFIWFFNFFYGIAVLHNTIQIVRFLWF